MMQQIILSWLIDLIWGVILSYSVFTFLLVLLWKKIPLHRASFSAAPVFISVIIPVRNEEESIVLLLADLASQTFPAHQLEVLVMNDNSTDRTAGLVTEFIKQNTISVRLINLSDSDTKSPKKRAIETAVLEAKGDLIVTTDGDCRAGKNWLLSIANCYASTQAKLISGPVTFTQEYSWTDHLQTVEFASLIGSGASAISAGFPSLCNGANLAYEKTAFIEVNGFDGVRHIASGDDEFLMHKIAAKYPNGVHFLKNAQAVIYTKPHQKWSLFFRQRKRWASKWKHYKSRTPLVLALYIFLCNFSLLLACLLFACSEIQFSGLALLWLLKCLPEWLFLGTVLRFLKKPDSAFYIPLTQIFYPFYVCFFGLAVQKPEYEWKGRKLR